MGWRPPTSMSKDASWGFGVTGHQLGTYDDPARRRSTSANRRHNRWLLLGQPGHAGFAQHSGGTAGELARLRDMQEG